MGKILLPEGAAPATPATDYVAMFGFTGGGFGFTNDLGVDVTFSAAADTAVTLPAGAGALTLTSGVAITTWTPSLRFGGASTGMTFTTQIGRYARAGNVVTFEITLVLSAKGSSTGAATIVTLPLASATVAGLVVPFQVFLSSGSTITAGNQVFATVTSNSTTLNLYNYAPTAAAATLTDANFGATTSLFIAGSYITSGY